MTHSTSLLPDPALLLSRVEDALAWCHATQTSHRCFAQILDEHARSDAVRITKAVHDGHDLPLAGLFFTAKENLCVAGVETTAGSRILAGYMPPFDAVAIARLRAQGAILIATTVMDEFGFGSFCVNVHEGRTPPVHPIDASRVTGGSSGGAGVAAARAPFPHVALGVSTGGSIENPAAYCGVIGYCPTYGAIPRTGLISYADSLDKIGVLARDLDLLAQVLPHLYGPDGQDATAIARVSLDILVPLHLRVGIIAETLDGITPVLRERIEYLAQRLRDVGHVVEEIPLPLTHTVSVPTYYVLATCEASTNLARYSGLRYGAQEDPTGETFLSHAIRARTTGFGVEAKRRILLGTFARTAGYREAYYRKALTLRDALRAEYDAAFTKYDILLTPTMPDVAPTVKESVSMSPAHAYHMDALTVAPNLVGVPHASFPVGSKEGLPLGAMAIAPWGKEASLLTFLRLACTLLEDGVQQKTGDAQ